jgi:hypothetical protein
MVYIILQHVLTTWTDFMTSTLLLHGFHPPYIIVTHDDSFLFLRTWAYYLKTNSVCIISVGYNHKVSYRCYACKRWTTHNIKHMTGSRDSAVGMATSYGLDGRGVGVRVPIGSRIFSSPRRPDSSGVNPTSYSIGTGDSSPWGNAAGAWSWPLTYVKNAVFWEMAPCISCVIYTSTPPYTFMA